VGLTAVFLPGFLQFFLRGLPHLCKFITVCKDGHKLKPDPKNEPDLYAISQKWPLPSQALASSLHSQPTVETVPPYRELALPEVAQANVAGETVTSTTNASVCSDLTKSPVSVIPASNEIAAAKKDPSVATMNRIDVATASESTPSNETASGIYLGQVGASVPTIPTLHGTTHQPPSMDAGVVLAIFLAQQQQQQQQRQQQQRQAYSSQSLASSQSQTQSEALASLLQNQVQSSAGVGSKQPSQHDIATAILMAEIQRLQAQEQASAYVTALLRNAVPPSQPQQHIQTAGASSSEADASALASALMTSFFQSQVSNGNSSF
jgi:hypothetical protein